MSYNSKRKVLYGRQLIRSSKIAGKGHPPSTLVILLVLLFFFSCSAKHSTMTDPTVLGTLDGRVTIGPICPVERIDQPCDPPPEMYAKHKLLVLAADTKKKVSEITMDGKGYFHEVLPPGDYLIDFVPHDIGISPPQPKEVNIVAGQKAWLDIDIDTGIR